MAHHGIFCANPACADRGVKDNFFRWYLEEGKITDEELVGLLDSVEGWGILDDHYLLSFDDSEFFDSKKNNCPNCQKKHHKNGMVTYIRQMLSAVVVHPDMAEVKRQRCSPGEFLTTRQKVNFR